MRQQVCHHEAARSLGSVGIERQSRGDFHERRQRRVDIGAKQVGLQQVEGGGRGGASVTVATERQRRCLHDRRTRRPAQPVARVAIDAEGKTDLLELQAQLVPTRPGAGRDGRRG